MLLASAACLAVASLASAAWLTLAFVCLLGDQVKGVFCGGYHTFAIAEDGNVYATGLNNYGQLGLGDAESRSRCELVDAFEGANIHCVRVREAVLVPLSRLVLVPGFPPHACAAVPTGWVAPLCGTVRGRPCVCVGPWRLRANRVGAH